MMLLQSPTQDNITAQRVEESRYARSINEKAAFKAAHSVSIYKLVSEVALAGNYTPGVVSSEAARRCACHSSRITTLLENGKLNLRLNSVKSIRLYFSNKNICAKMNLFYERS